MKSYLVSALLASAVAKRSYGGLDLIGQESLAAKINTMNAGWTAGVNERFLGMELDSIKRMMGTIVVEDDHRVAARAKLTGTPAPIVAAPPASFDARTAFPACADQIGHIRDQSDCGCCWAFATTEAANDRMCIKNKFQKTLSAQDMCSCCNSYQGCASGGCDGGYLEDAWAYLQTHGLVTGTDYDGIGKGDSCYPVQMPFCSHHEPGKYANCSAQEISTPTCPLQMSPAKGCTEAAYGTSWTADKTKAISGYPLANVAAIQADLQARGSVSVAFTVYQDFLTYKSGVYSHKTGPSMGGHAVKILGWGTLNGQDYWTVANSWNSYWGLNGTFLIARGVNECGIESQAYAGDV